MKKRYIISAITAVLILVGTANQSNSSPTSNINDTQSFKISANTPKKESNPKAICDGISVTSSCAIENISYKTYIYHPAVPEKSHTENVTVYEEKVVSTCTLCNDGSLSPTCAVGRGACSHHGGVNQYGYQIMGKVPTTAVRKVIDAPAKEAYYEKVAE